MEKGIKSEIAIKKESFNITAFPDNPGIYLFRDSNGSVIYVGKAKSIKKRVLSYFNGFNENSPKTKALVINSASLDYIVVNNEIEALVLENRMIKKYRPRYNVRLKDDKSFPYLAVTWDDEIPGFIKTRTKKKKSKNRYFGPFISALSITRLLKLLSMLFKVCTCPLNERSGLLKSWKMGKSVNCLKYSIQRCSGPCMGMISAEDYQKSAEMAQKFIESGGRDYIDFIKEKMKACAARQDFESAAWYRDLLGDLKALQVSQIVESQSATRADVFGIAGNKRIITIVVLTYTDGDFTARKNFSFPVTDPMVSPQLYESLTRNDEPEINRECAAEFLEEIIKAYYIDTPIAGEILLPFELPDKNNMEEWLSKTTDRRVIFKVPERGIKKKIINLARLNAMEQVKTGMRVIEKNDLKRQALANLKDLKQILGLAKTPVRIVCFDISNLGETEAVAGMTCFVKGEPSRGDYRKFRIKSVEGQNDFAMMNEAVSRYLGHIGQPGWERPDLILIDGGPGQLSAAMEALKAADEPNIEVISLAKRFEEVYVPGSGDPVIIPLESPASLLLRRVRDETHRFAISFHRTSRQKRFFKSILDDVPGLGPERKKLLIRKFRGIDNIAGLDYDAFKGMGIPVKTIKLLLEKLNKNQP